MEISKAIQVIERAKSNITMTIVLTKEVDEALEAILNCARKEMENYIKEK